MWAVHRDPNDSCWRPSPRLSASVPTPGLTASCCPFPTSACPGVPGRRGRGGRLPAPRGGSPAGRHPRTLPDDGVQRPARREPAVLVVCTLRPFSPPAVGMDRPDGSSPAAERRRTRRLPLVYRGSAQRMRTHRGAPSPRQRPGIPRTGAPVERDRQVRTAATPSVVDHATSPLTCPG